MAREIIAGVCRGETVFRIPEKLWTKDLASEIITFAEVNGNCATLLAPTESDKAVFLWMHPTRPNGERTCTRQDHLEPWKEAAANIAIAEELGKSLDPPGLVS